MANARDQGAGSRRRWGRAAWAAVVILLLTPFLVLYVQAATGEVLLTSACGEEIAQQDLSFRS